MESITSTLLLLLFFSTVIALLRTRKRDKCLTDFNTFHITMAEQGTDLCWGILDVYSTGLEINYVQPVKAREGHQEHSFIFYKEQYPAMDALYRYAVGLTEEQKEKRRAIILHTANPGFWRRMGRRMQNWISMIRDALLQAVNMVIGIAKDNKSAGTVLKNQEKQLNALSSEVIGHVGNAYDPLLEAHLFSQVVVEVTRNSRKYSYCGWLKDYTTDFVEILDAEANGPFTPLDLAAYPLDQEELEQVTIRVEAGRLKITNESAMMLYVDRASTSSWSRPLGCVLPPDYTADLTLPPEVRKQDVQVWIGSVNRVDMIIPRTHALIRHAASRQKKEVPIPLEAPADTPLETAQDSLNVETEGSRQ